MSRHDRDDNSHKFHDSAGIPRLEKSRRPREPLDWQDHLSQGQRHSLEELQHSERLSLRP
jgi:hypothetical protein